LEVIFANFHSELFSAPRTCYAAARRRQDLQRLGKELEGWTGDLDQRLQQEVEKRPEGRKLSRPDPQRAFQRGRQHFGRLTKQGNRLLRFLWVEAATGGSVSFPAGHRKISCPVSRVSYRRSFAGS
jgi:hypothetical protein